MTMVVDIPERQVVCCVARCRAIESRTDFAVHPTMHEDHDQLDQELARLAQSVRTGDHMLACLQLAEFALKLDHYITREERALSSEASRPKALSTVRREHSSLRQLVAAVANALDRADDHRGADLVGKLRSVLLLHVAKEELLLAPTISNAIH